MRNRVRSPAILLRAAVALVAVALALLPVAPLAPPAHAATFTITRPDDPPPDGCSPVDCSVREAVIAANSNPGPDTIIAGPGIATLTIPGNGEDAAATGDLDITDDLTVIGPGAASSIIDGGGFQFVLDVDPSVAGVSFDISGVTVRNGSTGIRNRGTLTLTDVTVTQNPGGGWGGGIRNDGTLTLTNVTVSDNTTTVQGGGILSTGTLTVSNSTISGNAANTRGGGISSTGTTKLNNVTITNNTADSDSNGSGDGGGVAQAGGTVSVKNSIIAGNTDGSPSAEAPDCSGTLISEGYNLIQDTTGCTIAGDTTGNVTGQDPLLGALLNNGGGTKTHALDGGSPAIDAGNPAPPGSGGDACEATDQRGEPRPRDGDAVAGARCDMGAYEVEDIENIDPNGDGSQYAYGENVGWINAEPSGNGGPGIQVSDSGLKGYMWGENIGWISLSCDNTDSCATTSYGVTNDGLGNLAGYAWGENVGWISFSCANTATCGTASYGVTINLTNGVFAGNAWGENIGWITFSDNAPFSFQVQTGWRSGLGHQGDVNCDNLVNVVDALFILQYEVGLRVDSGGCPLLLPPPDTLNVAGDDVNKDGVTNVVDALFILQCEVGDKPGANMGFCTP